MENRISDAILVSSCDSSKNAFPFCLMDRNSYTPFKALVAAIFICACFNFVAGFMQLFSWGSGWYLFQLVTKPMFFMFHIGLFSFFYLLTWAVFDQESFKKYIVKFMGIVAAIVYVCLPVDLIPDFLPLIGQIDDFMAVVIGVYSAVSMGKPYAELLKEKAMGQGNSSK